jgi:CheY-like chemotaxis protein
MTSFNKVFLIDDDAVFNLIHFKMINKFSFAKEVCVYQNAKDAWEEFKNCMHAGKLHLPEFIFLDINMPVMDGWEFLDELSKLDDAWFDHCKVVMLSSSIDAADIEKSRGYKMVVNYIAKPLTLQKLEAMSSGFYL